jgi:hypothetical protein
MKYEAGDVIKQTTRDGEHTYTLVATAAHLNRHGYATTVLIWEGRCATCGRPFEATSGPAGSRYLNRNCLIHRAKQLRVAVC